MIPDFKKFNGDKGRPIYATKIMRDRMELTRSRGYKPLARYL
jgi:hypothetical protein